MFLDVFSEKYGLYYHDLSTCIHRKYQITPLVFSQLTAQCLCTQQRSVPRGAILYHHSQGTGFQWQSVRVHAWRLKGSIGFYFQKEQLEIEWKLPRNHFWISNTGQFDVFFCCSWFSSTFLILLGCRVWHDAIHLVAALMSRRWMPSASW